MNKCKFFAMVALVTVCLSGTVAAKEKEVVYQPYELDKIIHEIDEPCAPIVTEDYIIFTAGVDHRSVGIAFDFENYQTIHQFGFKGSVVHKPSKTSLYFNVVNVC